MIAGCICLRRPREHRCSTLSFMSTAMRPRQGHRTATIFAPVAAVLVSLSLHSAVAQPRAAPSATAPAPPSRRADPAQFRPHPTSRHSAFGTVGVPSRRATSPPPSPPNPLRRGRGSRQRVAPRRCCSSWSRSAIHIVIHMVILTLQYTVYYEVTIHSEECISRSRRGGATLAVQSDGCSVSSRGRRRHRPARPPSNHPEHVKFVSV